VVEACTRLPCKAAITDGEIIVQDEKGMSDFDALRSAIHKAPHRIVFFAFDLLHLDGQDLRRSPLLERRAALRKLIPVMQLDTLTPTGKLMLNLMGSFAEFEREIMLERQREGVAKAKADGKYKGRVPTARRQSAEVIKLRGQGLRPEGIATQLGISRASVFRVLKDGRGASNRPNGMGRR
jgi:DNA invertase Pin-like site-specific DNA recombinase